MREWAYSNGLGEMYEEYMNACEEIAQQCVAEGYPENGSNYELRVYQLQADYPELFGE